MESWQAHIITLFPAVFPGPLGVSLSGQALAKKIWDMHCYDLRDFGTGTHKAIDGTPAGGGAGMVVRADIAAKALDTARDKAGEMPLLLMSPRGTPLTQKYVRKLATGKGAILFCNRFEGVDERFIKAYNIEEVSLGDYILAGGEVAALALLEAVIRLLPGVMGAAASADEESFERGLLEYPHYTRPATWRGYDIPDILLSGNHQKIAAWRHQQAENITRIRRPDLWARYQMKNNKKG